MSVREVQIIKCDRCGIEQEIGIISYPLPKKWLSVQGCGDLCPECAHRFKAFMMDFCGRGISKRKE